MLKSYRLLEFGRIKDRITNLRSIYFAKYPNKNLSRRSMPSAAMQGARMAQ